MQTSFSNLTRRGLLRCTNYGYSRMEKQIDEILRITSNEMVNFKNSSQLPCAKYSQACYCIAQLYVD